MVNSTSGLYKFILWSLGLHLLVVAAAVGFEYVANQRTPVQVSFSLGQREQMNEIQMVKERKIPTPKVSAKRPEVFPAPTKQVESAPVEQVTESTGFGSAVVTENAKNRYFSVIAQTIYKNKRYPRQAYSLNQEGKVVVRLKLDKAGQILDLQVLEKGPFKSLTNATLDTIKKINRFPQIPDELGVSEITFRIPIEYKIQM